MATENRVDIILITGASCSGKTHLGKKLTELGIPILDNDYEVMKRIFDLLPRERSRELHKHIGNENVWRSVRDYVDFDRLVRLHHRDWFLRHGCPRAFGAVGWMYSRLDHRQQVANAFTNVGSRCVTVKIARMRPLENVFVEQYFERLDNELENVAWNSITKRGPDARKDHALTMYKKYFDNDWQAPVDGTPWNDVQGVEGVLNLMEESNPFLQTDS